VREKEEMKTSWELGERESDQKARTTAVVVDCGVLKEIGQENMAPCERSRGGRRVAKGKSGDGGN